MKKGLLLVAGIIVGVLGYITFDNVLTPDATVIEAVEGTELYSGTFSDADPIHKAKGSFTIVSDGMGGRSIMLSNDFEVANAPDPHVKINGMLVAKNNWKGGQVFPISNIIAEEITDVRIWCEIAGVDLAHSSVMMGGMEMDMSVMGMMIPERTDALVTLGTTGNPKPYAMEMMGESKGKVSGAFTSVIKEALTMEEMETNAGFFGYAPEIAIVDGMTFRMVAPAHVKDNFVVSDMDGNWTRYDLGVDEGTGMITVVSEGKMMK